MNFIHVTWYRGGHEEIFPQLDRRENPLPPLCLRGHVRPPKDISAVLAAVGGFLAARMQPFLQTEKKRMESDAFRIIPRVSLHFDLSSDLTANRQPGNEE